MKRRLYRGTNLFFFSLMISFLATAGDLKKKSDAATSVERHKPELINLSNQIWAFAETALRETKSSKLLADYAEQQGFKVERGVAGMPTAFVATYGAGKPIIGILGEFDALPGISQKASSVKEAYEASAAGHGCGHNLFGAGSLGAAVAIKELIAAGKLKGTIRFYGTPAEESVGGKIYMARDGLFNDLDVCLAWHPDEKTRADVQSSQALVDFIVEFHGKAAHAAFDPWNGRSAVDGMELFTHGLNMLREHVKPSVRIHYTIQTGDYEMLVNMAGAKLLQTNLTWLGPIKYTEEEQAFARAIQRATGVEEKGLNGAIQPAGRAKA